MVINISFQVAKLEPTCPDFLFTIKGFTTLENSGILNIVRDIWMDHVTTGAFNGIVEDAPPDSRESTKKALSDFINPMWIRRLNIKTRGTCLIPEFNVYAKGAFIKDVRLWTNIRNFLARRIYVHKDLGKGRAVVAPYQCGICHGRDHPRGLCPFLEVDGWLGPKKNPAPKNKRGARSYRPVPRASFP